MDKYYIVKRDYTDIYNIKDEYAEMECEEKPFYSRIDADNPSVIEFCFNSKEDADRYMSL